MTVEDGRIATPVAFGPDEIERLYEGLGQDRPPKLVHVAANGSGEAGFEARVGQKAPDLSLPDLEGQSVRLADVQGKSRALLFFDPDCGFCAQMVDDLLACERRLPDGTELVLVSAGGVQEIRDLGLTSTILCDTTGQAAAAFGASGTPMAILLDEQGRIASRLAQGAEEVLNLVR